MFGPAQKYFPVTKYDANVSTSQNSLYKNLNTSLKCLKSHCSQNRSCSRQFNKKRENYHRKKIMPIPTNNCLWQLTLRTSLSKHNSFLNKSLFWVRDCMVLVLFLRKLLIFHHMSIQQILNFK